MPIPPAAVRDTADDSTRAVEQITCPFARVKAINAIVRDDCTLPGPLARLRTAALHEARELTSTVTELADKVGMKRTRVSTLLRHGPDTTARTRPVTATAQGAPAPC